MMIGRHKLTERQRMTVDSAQAQVMTSQIDPFLKHIFHALGAKQVIRDSDVRHATCAALVKLGGNPLMSATAISFDDWHEAEMADLRSRIDALICEAAGYHRAGVWDAIDYAKSAWYRGQPAEVERAIADLKWQLHREREWEAESLATAHAPFAINRKAAQ